MAETVLIVGSTGNIGVAAAIAALNAGHKVLAVVRNQSSAEKLFKHVGSKDGITVVEADVTSPTGVQSVVNKVKAGELPAFQHVYSTAGGAFEGTKLYEISDEEWRRTMTSNLDSNFYAYRATIPYLLEQKNPNSTWTICSGAAGYFGVRPGPAISQGGMFALAASAIRELAGTNIRFNESYLGARVEYDSVAAAQQGVTKSSEYAKIYEAILKDSSIRDSRVIVLGAEDLKKIKVEKNQGALFQFS